MRSNRLFHAAFPLLAAGAAIAVQRHKDKEQKAAEARLDAALATQAPTPPDADANWRKRLPGVVEAFKGREGPGLSRQEKRALMRTIGKLESSDARRNARMDAKLERKARRAGLRNKGDKL